MDNCKHKAAAESINWVVGLLKGKHGSDRRAAIDSIAQMLHEMKEKSCDRCKGRDNCHELDKAVKAVAEKDDHRAHIHLTHSIPGPLTIKKEHQRKMRLLRPLWR